MTTLSIQPPYPIITGADGQPLEDGYIWIGAANLNPQTNPVAVYWDAALSQPAGQPVRTRGGYPVNAGTPARLYVGSDYSILVQNKNGSTVYSAPSATERYGNIISFADITGTLGSDRVTFLQAGSGAVTRTAQSKMRDVVSVKDFGAVGDGLADDTLAIQAAVTALSANGGTLFFPQGTYKTTAPINWSPRVSLLGVGGHVGSIISGAHAGNIFQYTNIDFCIVEKLAFTGSGCSAFRQTGAGTNYTQNLTIRDCHFYGQLAECIYGNLIFAKIIDNTFGYYGTVGAAHRHIVSLGSSTNLTNANQIEGNRFYYAKGNESIRFDSGTDLHIRNNNFEQNTALPIRINGIFNTKIIDNWFEANSVATSEVEVNVGAHVIDTTPVEIQRNTFVPAASIVNIVQINAALAKVYFDLNTGDLTGKLISNNAAKVFSQIGNSFTGLTPAGYLTQETGTFTLTDASGAGLSFTGGTGTYTRNGNVISFTVAFAYPVTANGNNAKLTGLPYSLGALTPFVSADNSGAAVAWIGDAAAVTMVPYLVGALTPRTNAQLSGKQFYMAGSYQI
jgi:hypothetical protein